MALLLALAAVPPLLGGYVLHALANYLIFGLLTLSVGLLVGYGRLPTLGGGVAFGAGAYAVAWASNAGVSHPLLALAAALLAGALAAIPFAVYASIATGTQYLMLTYVTVVLVTALPAAWPLLPPSTIAHATSLAFGLDPLHDVGFYWLVLAVVAACIALAWLVIRSPAGRAAQAMGRNPVRLAAMGYPVGLYRAALTLFSSLLAAIAGWLYALHSAFVTVDLLGQSSSIRGLSGALVGGATTILGPLLGSTLLGILENQLSRGSTQSSLFFGAALVVSLILLPDGLLGRLTRLWSARGVNKRC